MYILFIQTVECIKFDPYGNYKKYSMLTKNGTIVTL